MLSDISDFLEDIRDPDMIPASVIIYSLDAPSKEMIELLYDTMYGYFIGEIIDSLTVELIVDCFASVFSNKEYVSEELILNGTYFIISIINETDFEISSGAIEKIIHTLELYLGILDINEILIAFEFFSDEWVYQLNPDQVLKYENSFSLFRIRMIGSNLKNYTITADYCNITFPYNTSFENNYVYDVSFEIIPLNETTLINVNIFQSGVFENYSLVLIDLIDANISLSDPIEIEIKNSLDFASLECYNYLNNDTSEYCRIENISTTSIFIEINSKGTYAFRQKEIITSSTNRAVWAPVTIMAALLSLFLLGVGGFFGILKGDSFTQTTKKDIIILIPIINIFRNQPILNRASISFQLISCQLFILSLIGWTYLFFDDPINKTDFPSYKIEHLKYAVIALFICQCYSAPIFALYYKALTQKKILYFHCIICLFVSLASIAFISILNTYYSPDVVINWTINYFISAVLEIIFEGIYTFVGLKVFGDVKGKSDRNYKKSLDFMNDEKDKEEKECDKEVPKDEISDEESYYEIVHK
ncbi:hypothetical protein SteCoe_36112 [Stentor coeruleus]|uniref:Uncharacterized protein n=1 Tax=Stentor coeruleus TaxID=5963 RepID=A0A1R2AQT2_9CILI|nr:hypothetical protein SteCoe_36112 [Stentor coeruleus]